MCVWTSRRKKREWMKTGLTGNIFSVMCTWHVIRYLSISSDSNYSAVLEIKIVLVTIQLSIYYLRGTLLSMLYVVTHLFLTRIQCGKHNYWRRQWHPTPVLLPGKFHGLRSLVGYSPWGRKEYFHFHNIETTSSGFEANLTMKPGSFPHYTGDLSQVNLLFLASFPHL